MIDKLGESAASCNAVSRANGIAREADLAAAGIRSPFELVMR